MMARVLLDLHPELVHVLGVNDFMDVLRQRPNADSDSSADYLAMIEGIKAWARILDKQQVLGRAAWHDEFLTAVFNLSFLQGMLASSAEATSNFHGAYEYIIREFEKRTKGAIGREIAAHEFTKAGFVGTGL
jgi:hypothetical protein